MKSQERKLSLKNLTLLERGLQTLLYQLGAEGEMLAGMMLVLIRVMTEKERENYFLWMYDNHPTLEQVQERMVKDLKMMGDRADQRPLQEKLASK